MTSGISVKDRLAEKSGKYLVWTENTGVETCYWSYIRRKWNGGAWTSHITHWMLPPERPEQSEMEYVLNSELHISPCDGPCNGLNCCNCCGEAPAMHRAGQEYIPFQRYDDLCCKRARVGMPESCMQLQGKTRAEWLKELSEPPEEGENDGTTKR